MSNLEINTIELQNLLNIAKNLPSAEDLVKVKSVNGKIGDVVLTAEDVQALSDTMTSLSMFENDTDFANKNYVNEIASGKCKVYIKSFRSKNDPSYVETPDEDILEEWLKKVDKSQFNSGDIFLIRDTGVPDYWWDKDRQTIQILETTKVPIENYLEKKELTNAINEALTIAKESGDFKGEQGAQGETGPQGPEGPQGPIGETGPMGETGPTGATGATGPSGATFTPNVTLNGTLSWTNDKDLTNPSSINIKGPQGDQGPIGPQGDQGPPGLQGPEGPPGADGADGTSISHEWNGTTLTVISASGTSSADLKGPQGNPGDKGEKGDKGDKGDDGKQGPEGPQGPQGIQGEQGAKGETGKPFSIAKTYVTVEEMNDDYNNPAIEVGSFVMIVSDTNAEDNAKLFVKGENSYTFIVDMSGMQGIQGPQGDQGPAGVQGPQGAQGPQGDPGVTPQNGTDYFTETEKEEFVNRVIQALPPSGETGEQEFYEIEIEVETILNENYIPTGFAGVTVEETIEKILEEKQKGKKILAKIIPVMSGQALGLQVFALLTVQESKENYNNLIFDFVVDLIGNGTPSFIRIEGNDRNGDDRWSTIFKPLNSSGGSGDSGAAEDEIFYVPLKVSVDEETGQPTGASISDPNITYDSIIENIDNGKIAIAHASYLGIIDVYALLNMFSDEGLLFSAQTSIGKMTLVISKENDNTKVDFNIDPGPTFIDYPEGSEGDVKGQDDNIPNLRLVNDLIVDMTRKNLKPYEIYCEVNNNGDGFTDNLNAPPMGNVTSNQIYDKIIGAYRANFHVYLECDLTNLSKKPQFANSTLGIAFLNLSRITSFEAIFENVANIDNNYYHLKGVIKPGDETSFEIIPIITSDADTINGYSLKITNEKTPGTADNVITFVVEG